MQETPATSWIRGVTVINGGRHMYAGFAMEIGLGQYVTKERPRATQVGISRHSGSENETSYYPHLA